MPWEGPTSSALANDDKWVKRFRAALDPLLMFCQDTWPCLGSRWAELAGGANLGFNSAVTV